MIGWCVTVGCVRQGVKWQVKGSSLLATWAASGAGPSGVRRRALAIMVLLLLSLTACVGPNPPDAEGSSATLTGNGASLASDRLAARKVLSATDAYGLRSAESSWLDQRQQFTNDVGTAGSVPVLLRTVSSALRAGGGLHSFLLLADASASAVGFREPSVSVRGGVGVVSVPATAGLTTRQEQQYASALDGAIQAPRDRVCG